MDKRFHPGICQQHPAVPMSQAAHRASFRFFNPGNSLPGFQPPVFQIRQGILCLPQIGLIPGIPVLLTQDQHRPGVAIGQIQMPVPADISAHDLYMDARISPVPGFPGDLIEQLIGICHRPFPAIHPCIFRDRASFPAADPVCV